MPLAHAVGNALKYGSEMSRLLTSLYSIMYERDDEAFHAVLETLRAEGLIDLWQYFWDRATDMACAKSYEMTPDFSFSALFSISRADWAMTGCTLVNWPLPSLQPYCSSGSCSVCIMRSKATSTLSRVGSLR